MLKKLYIYKAFVEEVYDGDTITVDIDLGFKTHLKGEKVRLNRIDAPELRGSTRTKGLKSRDFLREQILGKEVFIETIKDKQEKYGRYLAEVHLEIEKDKFIIVNDLLVEKGFAIYRKY
ncbi:MAG: thermonuclease family protein [bacterium]